MAYLRCHGLTRPIVCRQNWPGTTSDLSTSTHRSQATLNFFWYSRRHGNCVGTTVRAPNASPNSHHQLSSRHRCNKAALSAAAAPLGHTSKTTAPHLPVPRTRRPRSTYGHGGQPPTPANRSYVIPIFQLLSLFFTHRSLCVTCILAGIRTPPFAPVIMPRGAHGAESVTSVQSFPLSERQTSLSEGFFSRSTVPVSPWISLMKPGNHKQSVSTDPQHATM